MASATMIVNANAERVARVATNGGVRSGTFRLRRPLGSRLDAWLLVGWPAFEADFVRRLADELRVGSMFVEPLDPSIQFLAETCDVQRYNDSSTAFVLQREDCPFDDSNATVLANRAEALLNIVHRVFAPVDKRTASFLVGLIRQPPDMIIL